MASLEMIHLVCGVAGATLLWFLQKQGHVSVPVTPGQPAPAPVPDQLANHPVLARIETNLQKVLDAVGSVTAPPAAGGTLDVQTVLSRVLDLSSKLAGMMQAQTPAPPAK